MSLQIAVSSVCLLFSTVGLQTAAVADDLFSESRLDTVFIAPSQTQPAEQQPGTPPQATKVTREQLESIVRAAGYEPRKVADNVYAVEVAKDNFRFPIGFTISPNGENVWIVLVLNTIDDNAVSPRVLLGLMAANSTYGPAHFVYDPQGKRIDLNRALLNVNLQPSDLKREVDICVDIAVKTADLWSNPQGNGQPTQPTTPIQQPTQPVTNPEPANQVKQADPLAPQQTQTQPAANQNDIAGKWSAEPQQGVTFVIDFAADGTFVLNFRNPQGQTDITKGRYTLTADTLTLAGDDGQTLSGKFNRVDANTFVFVPTTSGANITFVRS